MQARPDKCALTNRKQTTIYSTSSSVSVECCIEHVNHHSMLISEKKKQYFYQSVYSINDNNSNDDRESAFSIVITVF